MWGRCGYRDKEWRRVASINTSAYELCPTLMSILDNTFMYVSLSWPSAWTITFHLDAGPWPTMVDGLRREFVDCVWQFLSNPHRKWGGCSLFLVVFMFRSVHSTRLHVPATTDAFFRLLELLTLILVLATFIVWSLCTHMFMGMLSVSLYSLWPTLY